MEWLVMYIIFVALIGWWASNLGRNVLACVICAAFISPLVVGLYLLVAGKSGDSNKKCPKCAEMINNEATVCKHCGSVFSNTERNTSAWAKELNNDEKLVCEFGVADKFIYWDTIIGAVIGVLLIPLIIGVILLPAGLFYSLFYLRRSRMYALTDKRVISISGWLNKSKNYIDYVKITDISINQKMLDRWLGTGALLINTAGGPNHEIVMSPIANPKEIKDIIHKLMSNAAPNIKEDHGTEGNGVYYIEELERLADLKNKNIITVDEFEIKKKQILGLSR